MSTVLPPVRRHKRPEVFLASANQERLYRAEHAAPLTQPGVTFSLSILGPCNERILRDALASVVKRHEALRTEFALSGDALKQRVCDDVEVSWRQVNLRTERAFDRAWLSDEASRLAATPMDLGRAPLLRVVEAVYGDSDRMLLIDIHHLVSDGWCISLFISDLVEAYTHIASGRSISCMPHPLQFGDFALWEKKLLASPLGQKAKEYWQRHFESLPAFGSGTQPIAKRKSFEARTLARDLDSEILQVVAAFAKTHGVRGMSVLLSAHALASTLRNKPEDAFISMPVFNRRAAGSRQIFGWLANAFPLFLRVSNTSKAIDVVRQTHTALCEIADYDFMPMGSLGGDGSLRRQRARVLFSLVPIGQTDRRAGDVAFRLISMEGSVLSTFYDYCIYVIETRSGVRLYIGYHQDAVSDADAEVIASCFVSSLQEILNAPFDSVPDCLRMLSKFSEGTTIE